MAMKMYEALPTWFGGKRRLIGRIFKHLPSCSEAPVFADCFLGGGSVSLAAKARGYSVRANDIAERSTVVGRALLENDTETLSRADVARLFVDQHHDAFCETHLAPDVVTPAHARFLDNALAVARSTRGAKGDLMLLLCVKYLLGQRPMGNFGAKKIVHQLAEGDFDAVNPAYLKDAVQRMVLAHPWDVAQKLAGKVNLGVFANGHDDHRVTQGDVLDFLAETRADVLYMDPPYPGTLDYSVALRPLDEMLAGETLQPERSRFSRTDAMAFIEEMLAAAQHIPVWAVSLGGPAVDLRTLHDLMSKYRRRVHAEAVKYAHLAALASDESKEKNVELLLVGWA